ncbi:DUF1810 domain-containing protein [Salipiger sp. P9]|uniref:DUF1810 domain-containing protein n=1 Tax=Salipiger pentaromativorans TaxID=2943193 RepID=UPI0021575965|nr:DUF1810 domain-containing protein [Salipiger pentaromativorans]MCR8549558.1 DUF1810 domain-containing protein [Salipiger pentaromativorans]
MAELQDFLDAQNQHWPQIVAELRDGRKVTHWIWYVFPQLKILGRSGMARHFGIADLEEASAYLSHPVLGPRLEEVASLLRAHAGTDPVEILGPVDALKVKSSMTLFEAVPGAAPVFSQVLNSLYSGARCPVTRDALR